MVPSTVAPTQQESLGSGISSEAEIVKTLLPNPDQDTEMADARGKNVLHHSCSSSAEDDSPLNPPKKRASPNRRGKAPPRSSTGTDQLPRSLRSATPYPTLRCPQLRHSPARLGLTTIPQSTRPVAQYQWSWNTNLYLPSHRRQPLRQRTNHRCSHSGDHDESVPPPHHLVSSPQLRWPP